MSRTNSCVRCHLEMFAYISLNSDDPFHKQLSFFRKCVERNLYPVFDLNLLFTLWNKAILRHDSVSRPITPAFGPRCLVFMQLDPDHLRKPPFWNKVYKSRIFERMENFQNNCCRRWTKKLFKNSYLRQLRIVNAVVS